MKVCIILALSAIIIIEVIVLFKKLQSYITRKMKLEELKHSIMQEHEKQRNFLEKNTPVLEEKIKRLEHKLNLLVKSNQAIMDESESQVREALLLVKKSEDMYFSLCDRVNLLSEISQNPNNNNEQIQEYIDLLAVDIESEKKRIQQEKEERIERQKRIKKDRDYTISYDWDFDR